MRSIFAAFFFFALMSFALRSFAGEYDSLELRCSGPLGGYEILVQSEIPGPSDPTRSEAFYKSGEVLKAYVTNTYDHSTIVLQRGEFGLEWVFGQRWIFADYVERKILQCQEKNPELRIQEGKLIRIAGIGGESTGIGLKLSTGSHLEVAGADEKITAKLLSLMDSRVVLHGVFKFKRGVERGLYKVFVATKIEGRTTPPPRNTAR